MFVETSTLPSTIFISRFLFLGIHLLYCSPLSRHPISLAVQSTITSNTSPHQAVRVVLHSTAPRELSRSTPIIMKLTSLRASRLTPGFSRAIRLLSRFLRHQLIVAFPHSISWKRSQRDGRGELQSRHRHGHP